MVELCDSICLLPTEIKREIFKFVYKKCDICFRRIEFWNVYNMKDIYHIRMENNSFTFVYVFLNNNKKLCGYCYSIIKYWFR